MKKRFLAGVMGFALTLSMGALVACGSANDGEADVTVSESDTNLGELSSNELYESVISQLKPGQAYAFADICPSYDVLLVSEDGAYDNLDGNMAATKAKIYALDADGKVMEYGEEESGGTAYPLAVYDGCLMIFGNHRTMMSYVDDKACSLITKKCFEVSYDKDGNPSYGYMDADTQTDEKVDDDSKMKEMLEMYDDAVVINFTEIK